MSTPPIPPDQPDQPDRPEAHEAQPAPDSGPSQPETGPTEPITSGDPLGDGPERPQEESPPPAAAAAPAAGPRRLSRSSSDRVLGGVSGGLGRYFDIDPIIFRIGFVVLALAGGAGFLAYAAAWLFVPGDPVSGAAPGGRNRALTYIGAGILAVAVIAVLGEGLFFVGPPLFGLALLALLGAGLWRVAENRGDEGNRTLRHAVLAIGLLIAAVVGFVAVVIGAATGGGAVIAGLVIAVGAALAASAFVGGARWLVLPALILAIPLGFVAAAGIDADGGVGERDYRPTTVAEVRDGYELGVGELKLDLRDVDLPAGRTPLKLDMGVGSVRVLVPEDVCVASDVRIGAGYARVLDRDSAGIDVDWRQSPPDAATAKRLVIAGEVGIGELQVAHNVEDFDDHRRRGSAGYDFDDHDDFNEIGELGDGDADAACAETA